MSGDDTIKCYDSHSKTYDLFQSTVVPQYDTAIEITAMTVEKYVENPIMRVLDLGCGTGNASAAILTKFPKAHFSLEDGSATMIDVAKKKLGEMSPRAVEGSKVANLADEKWHQGMRPGFDVVVSTFVLEHLNFEIYRAVLATCHELLKPGGGLIAVDGYVEDEYDMLGWFVEQTEKRKALLSDPELLNIVSKLRAEQETHYYCSKSQKLSWWNGAGFDGVHVVWQYLCIALMAGQKPFS